jgi:hypothetical protein
MVIEVFKTNVIQPAHATMLVELIQVNFDGYTANFDLADCDKILRIACGKTIQTAGVLNLVKRFGFEAEVLSDDIPEVLQF